MWTFNLHRKTLAALWGLYGVICFVEVAWVAVHVQSFTVMWGAILSRVPNPYPWMRLFQAALVVGVALLVLAALFSLLAASALLARSRSRRNMTLVAGFLGLVTGPLGLALGVYTLVLALPRAADQTYDTLATAA